MSKNGSLVRIFIDNNNIHFESKSNYFWPLKYKIKEEMKSQIINSIFCSLLWTLVQLRRRMKDKMSWDYKWLFCLVDSLVRLLLTTMINDLTLAGQLTKTRQDREQLTQLDNWWWKDNFQDWFRKLHSSDFKWNCKSKSQKFRLN